MITFRCTHCGKELKVSDQVAGKKARCPGCASVMVAPGTTAPLVTNPIPVGSAAPGDGWTFLAPAQAADEIGRLGNYRVFKAIGAGGMGAVFHAQDVLLERFVALKVMLPALASDPSAKERFFREAKAAAALKHPHIVTIHQVGEDRGCPFLAMELLAGESLEARLRRLPQLSVAEVLRLGRQIAEGLAAAHARGLVHRDIKPANIWLETTADSPPTSSSDTTSLPPTVAYSPTAPEQVKILDFGLARATSDPNRLTQSGAIVGTPAYMAPEQAGGGTVDARSDLFSLGCVLYRMCTGEMAFRGPDIMSVLSALALHQPQAPMSLNSEIPAGLSALVMQLLAKKPEERPASAQIVASALQEMENDPTAQLRPARKTRPRLTWLWLVGGAAMVFLLCILGLGGFLAAAFLPRGPAPKSSDPPTPIVNAPAPEPGKPVALGCTDTLPGHTKAIMWVVFAPDGNTLASAADDGTVRLWDLTKENRQRASAGPVAGRVICADIRNNGKMLASASQGVSLWRTEDGKKIADLSDSNRGNGGVAFSPDGKRLAAACLDPNIRVWNPDTPQEKPLLLVGKENHTCVVWVGGNQTVAAGAYSGKVYVWDLAKPDKPISFQAHSAKIEMVAVSPDGETLATAGHDGCARFWTKQGERLSELPIPGKVLCVAFSPNGKLIATSSNDGLVRVWARADNKLMAIGTGHARPSEVMAVAFAPNGLILASGSSDNNVRLWDVSGLAGK